MKENPSILIVDDDKPTADSLQKRLKKSHPGWDLQTCYSLKQADALLEASGYDAVVTDYRLDDHDPSKTGLKVIEKAREKDRLCICLLMTAYPEDFDRYKDAFKKGVTDCIIKSQRGLDVGKEIEFKLKLELQRRWEHEEAYHYARHIDIHLRMAWGSTSKRSKLNQRPAAMMFTGIRGFSEVAHQLQTRCHLIVSFLEKLYSVIIEEVHRQEGIVDKFMGDSSLCLFGATSGFDGDRCCKDAVQAAVSIQDRWEKLEMEFRQEVMNTLGINLLPLALGIGIHFEEVMVGIVQTEKGRDQFTAIGSGVNVAKKLEGYSSRPVQADGRIKQKIPRKYGCILVTAPVQICLMNLFDLHREEPDLILIKNHPPYPIWAVRPIQVE